MPVSVLFQCQGLRVEPDLMSVHRCALISKFEPDRNVSDLSHNRIPLVHLCPMSGLESAILHSSFQSFNLCILSMLRGSVSFSFLVSLPGLTNLSLNITWKMDFRHIPITFDLLSPYIPTDPI